MRAPEQERSQDNKQNAAGISGDHWASRTELSGLLPKASPDVRDQRGNVRFREQRRLI